MNLKSALRTTYNEMQSLYGAADDVNYQAMGDIVDEFFTRNGVP